MVKNQPRTKNQFIDIDNARVSEQVAVMEQIMTAGECPFCLDNLHKYHRAPILKEGKYWIVTKNYWPYQNTKVHLLAIYKQHVENLAGLDPASGVELLELMAWAEKEFEAPGGGWAMRFGDTDYSAGTVAHIHAQFLVPDIHAPGYELKPVRFKIGKILEK